MSDELRGLFENEVIRASAGTGKTFTLSNRFLRLLASGVDCETILATTFTRKGAGEILDRIVQRLALAATSDMETKKLARALDWELDSARVKDLLRELIQSLHRLQIGTLDAFFYRIAQSFRLELGLPTQWQIVNEQQIATLQSRVIYEILRDDHVIEILHLLTKGEAQRRIADLIRQTVNELYQIFIGSEISAWNRLPKPTSFNPNQNFDDLAERLRAIQYPTKNHLNQIEKELPLIESKDWLALAQGNVFNRILNRELVYYRKPIPDECVEVYQTLIEHCRAVVIDMLIRKNLSTFRLLEAFSGKLEIEKTETGQLRFDDITSRLESFIRHRDLDDFAFRLDHNINHLLLDEFQDTSISQWNVIEPFAEKTTLHDSQKSFFCVGDLKQAIFGWRGGVAEIFDTVESNLSNMSDAEPLLKSYRSSQTIMDSVNGVFENLGRYRHDDNLIVEAVHQWGNRFEKHSTSKTELPGYFSVEYTADSDAKPRSEQNRRRNENLLSAAVEKIKTIRESSPAATIGVLVRKNDLVGKLIYRLREAGVSASEEGGNLLTDSAAVETMLSLCTLADHPGDSVARFHLSNTALAPSLMLEPECIANQTQNQIAARSAAALLRNEFCNCGFGLSLEKYARVLSQSCTRRELSRLQQLVQEAFNFEQASDKIATKLRPTKFVEFIRSEFKASDETSANVRVMTIHQSKGLEFDIVVLPMPYEQSGWFGHQDPVIVGREHPTEPINLVCRLANEHHRNLLPAEFQQAYEKNKQQQVQEELCVLYVAMTRAIFATHVLLSYGCKQQQSSSSSVLLSTLVIENRKEGIVHSEGDSNWHSRIQFGSSARKDERRQPFYLDEDSVLNPSQLKTSAVSGRGTKFISPSQATETGLDHFFSTPNATGLRRGSFLHACFESIRWLDEKKIGKRQLKGLAHKKQFFEPEVEKWIDDFFRLTQKPELKRLLSRQSYLQTVVPNLLATSKLIYDSLDLVVEHERPFAIKMENGLTTGLLDRFVKIYEGEQLVGAHVIDFKTDRINSDQLEDRISHHRDQLETYRRVAIRLTALPPDSVLASLVFTELDEIVNVNNGTIEKPFLKRPKFQQEKQMRLW